MTTNGGGTFKSGTGAETGSMRIQTKTRRRSGTPGTLSNRTPAAPAKSDAPVVDSAVDDPVVETGGAREALAASETDLAKLQAARRSKVIKAAILTVIALILITFVLQNAQPVGVQLLAWTVSIRLIWVIVAAAVLGALGGYLVGRPDRRLLLHGPSRREEDPL